LELGGIRSVDLYRIYIDDEKVKTKNATLKKLRDSKKECRTEINNLEIEEDKLRS
jgi:cell division protein FtsB